MQTGNRFCLQCQSPLDELASSRCPGCGRPFDPDNSTTFATTTTVMHGASIPLGGATLIAVVLLFAAAGGNLTGLIHIPGLVGLLGIVTGGLVLCHGGAGLRGVGKAIVGRRVLDAAQLRRDLAMLRTAVRLAWVGGLIVTLLGIVQMTTDLHDPLMIGHAISASLLPLLYASILAELILRPLGHVLISRSGIDPANLSY